MAGTAIASGTFPAHPPPPVPTRWGGLWTPTLPRLSTAAAGQAALGASQPVPLHSTPGQPPLALPQGCPFPGESQPSVEGVGLHQRPQCPRSGGQRSDPGAHRAAPVRPRESPPSCLSPSSCGRPSPVSVLPLQRGPRPRLSWPRLHRAGSTSAPLRSWVARTSGDPFHQPTPPQEPRGGTWRPGSRLPGHR